MKAELAVEDGLCPALIPVCRMRNSGISFLYISRARPGHSSLLSGAERAAFPDLFLLLDVGPALQDEAETSANHLVSREVPSRPALHRRSSPPPQSELDNYKQKCNH